jgi:competence protein ComEC
VPATVARIPVSTFVDHGPSVSINPGIAAGFSRYLELTAKAKRLVVQPGNKIPIKGVEVRVVSSAGKVIPSPVKGPGAINSLCQTSPPKPNRDESENAESIGLLYTFRRFRMLDLADLTWNKELELMCPRNPIGRVDLFMVSHHGNDLSNSPALIHALQPKVTIPITAFVSEQIP